MAEATRLASALLGHVLAHEIGHLLLAINSHSISGSCTGRGLARIAEISEGTIFYAKRVQNNAGTALAFFVACGPATAIGVEALSFPRDRNRD